VDSNEITSNAKAAPIAAFVILQGGNITTYGITISSSCRRAAGLGLLQFIFIFARTNQLRVRPEKTAFSFS